LIKFEHPHVPGDYTIADLAAFKGNVVSSEVDFPCVPFLDGPKLAVGHILNFNFHVAAGFCSFKEHD
jgi:hypothetical protein